MVLFWHLYRSCLPEWIRLVLVRILPAWFLHNRHGDALAGMSWPFSPADEIRKIPSLRQMGLFRSFPSWPGQAGR
jgi:hypothetical protein